jgi:molecular chaperone HscB
MPQAFDFNRTHFELFGLVPRFAVDSAALDQAYRALQSQVHPDKFAHLSEPERRAAMQWATQVNGAYQTLKSPQQRAKYLIELAGGIVDNQGNAGLPPEFLMEQMEWREQVEAARDAGEIPALNALARDAADQIQSLHAELAKTIDQERDFAAARLVLFRLMFLDKLREEIADALDELDTVL